MNPLALFRPRRLEFVEPALADDEYEKETDEEREMRLIDAGLHTGIAELKYRPMLWTRDAPDKAGWYWVKRIGEPRFEAVYVEDGYEYPGLFEWSSCQLPTPHEPGMPRRVRRP